ncbi:MAG: hypothetical protein ACF8CQ_20485 [Rhodopirellula sp. JB044]|uniref:hypothetical protein n=1 Tax=Rhodopirellula sp. JB044 TaxID=3342844 RepID=UPI00370A7187
MLSFRRPDWLFSSGLIQLASFGCESDNAAWLSHPFLSLEQRSDQTAVLPNGRLVAIGEYIDWK